MLSVATMWNSNHADGCNPVMESALKSSGRLYSGFSFLLLFFFVSVITICGVTTLIRSGLSSGVLLWTELKTKTVRIMCKIRANPSV